MVAIQNMLEVRTLFWKAIELSPQDRQAYVYRNASSEQIAIEVTSLLEYMETEPHTQSEIAQDQRILPPTKIGGCQIIRRIGSGGMGVVYQARQQNPSRDVAIKVLRPEVATDRDMLRLRAEAEVLGTLSSAGIATIHTSGISEHGGSPSPYIVMEFIENAQPIDEYARAVDLDIPQRLRLFLEVCTAIQHAHAHGVIHRDIKPSNILIDENGNAKIIDFGIASTQHAGIEHRTMTGTGEILGTLPFMPPELLTEQPDAASTACDVYSLGVVLYLLLAGRLPHEVAGLPLWKAVQLIRACKTAPPSKHTADVTQDLNAITLKCLDADPGARYQNTSDLADDIKRYLNSKPVHAHRPTYAHQFRLFVRRHRVASALATSALTILMLGATTSTVLAIRESTAREDAVLEANRLTEVMNTLLENVFSSADPRTTNGKDLTIAQAVITASDRVDQIEDPFVRGAVQSRLSIVLSETGQHDEALDHANSAIQIFAAAKRRTDKRELARAWRARALAESVAGEYRAAFESNQWTIDILQTIGPRDIRLAEAIGASASMLTALGESDRAVELGRQAEVIALSDAQPHHPELIKIRMFLAQAYEYAGKLDAAKQTLETTLESQLASNRASSPATAATMVRLGNVVGRLGDIQRALQLQEDALLLRRQTLPADHPDLTQSIASIGTAAFRAGEFGRASNLLCQALAGYENQFGPNHPFVARMLVSSAAALSKSGSLEQAEEHIRRAIGIYESSENQDHVRIGAAWSMLGGVLSTQHRIPEAEAALTLAESFFTESTNPGLLEIHNQRRTDLAARSAEIESVTED